MPRLQRLALPLGIVLSLLVLLHLFSVSQPRFPDATSTAAKPSHSLISSIHHTPQLPSQRDPSRSVELEIDKRGLTTYKPGSKRHPIEVLIENAKTQAKALEARIDGVQNLDDAIEEYIQGFGMVPPKGFDKWYKFTQSSPSPHSPPVAPLLPYAHDPMLAFLSLPASLIRERLQQVRQKGSIFTFTFVPDGQGDKGTACKTDESWIPSDWENQGKGMVKIQGQGAWSWRCNNTLTLLLPMLPTLPAELFKMNPPLELAFSIDDGPRGMVHDDLRDRAEAYAKAGKVWPPAQLAKAEKAMGWTYGWQWSCPEGTLMKTQATDLVLNDVMGLADIAQGTEMASKSFIADFDGSVDFCHNPDLSNYHHVLLSANSRAAVDLVPVVATCRTKWNSDILGVPLDGVYEKAEYIPWEEKTKAKAFWRGSATGLFHSRTMPWRQSQRERLHFFANNATQATVPLLLDKGSEGLVVEDWDVQVLRDRWLDVGLSGKPVQCDVKDGSCDDMEREIEFLGRVGKEGSTKYKFVIDVDGNGWSSRYRRLLAGNNVVLKSTLYPEWFQELLIPWYHYVPLKLDYTDLYDILAFFMGSPDGSVKGRDDLAEEIAKNGLEFTRDRWRMVDMQSYMYLLIIEYWRALSDDRREASYSL